MASQEDITELLTRLGEGDQAASNRLTPILYDELRKIAGALMRRERLDHTLQATALVHEAYCKLVDQTRVDWRGQTHFLAVAAQAMRRILVDHARGRNRQKRQGDRRRVMLDTGLAAGAPAVDILELDDLLDKLKELDEQQHRIAELKLFGDLELKQIALLLDVHEQTIRRDWTMARKWLKNQLGGEGR